MTASSTLPGPCYPRWPDMRGAYAVHRRSNDGKTCRYCGLAWDESTEPRHGLTGEVLVALGRRLGAKEET